MTEEVKDVVTNDVISITKTELNDIIQKSIKDSLMQKKEEVEVDNSFENNLAKLETDNSLKENAKRELYLESVFEELPIVLSDVERAAFDISTNESKIITKMNKIMEDKDLCNFVNKKDLYKIESMLKDGSKDDKLKFLFEFTEIIAEARDRLALVDNEYTNKFGAEISKFGIKEVNEFSVESLTNPDVKRVFSNLKK